MRPASCPLEHAVELGQLYIAIPWQRRGIGTALVRSVVSRAFAAAKACELTVMTNNVGARALYERLGFVARDEGPIKVWMRHEGGGQEPPSASDAGLGPRRRRPTPAWRCGAYPRHDSNVRPAD